jgi:hypothetical protein
LAFYSLVVLLTKQSVSELSKIKIEVLDYGSTVCSNRNKKLCTVPFYQASKVSAMINNLDICELQNTEGHHYFRENSSF